MVDHPRALALIAGIFASILQPHDAKPHAAWAADNMIVPDGPRAGDLWDPSLTPYIAPILDELGPEAAHNIVAVRKSVQTGVSVAGLAFVGSIIDQAPARIGFAMPTIDALNEFNREKLEPVLDQTKALKAKVRGQISRSSKGSTAYSKRFPGGSLALMNANAVKDMKSKTLKNGVADEIDDWPFDLDGQGDAWELYLGRFTAFHATADWRVLALSTPTLSGGSRIDDLFQAGDQRYWHIDCPGCGEAIRLEYAHLQHDRRPPYRAFYAAQCCGHTIEPYERSTLIRAGRFVATNPDGLYPSFHVDALISLLTTWDNVAEKAVASEQSEEKAKSFYNNVLGLPYEVKGNAPDWQRLMERREDYEAGVVPAAGLLLVAGADVQHDGIWAEVVAFGEDRQSWSIHAQFLDGPTDNPRGGAFDKLAALHRTLFVDAYGNERRIEALAVDGGDGARTSQVLEWCRRTPDAYSIKGQSGRGIPAIALPQKKSVTKGGKRKRFGSSMQWPVGTWGLKSELYANLHKPGLAAGEQSDPPGYCHFHRGLTEEFFKQLTAEYFDRQMIKGKLHEEWKRARRENHFLDARVYAMAMAEHLGLSRNSSDEWARLRRIYERGPEVDLLTPTAIRTTQPEPEAVTVKVETPTPTAEAERAREERRRKWLRR